MSKRGFSSEEEMLAFLNMTPEMLPKFSTLFCGREVLDGVNAAIYDGSCITIYGDYDCDGVMAMTILHKGLSRLSPGKVRWFANERFTDGYSITPASLSRMLGKYPDTQVIISCDNGIGAAEAWDEAIRRGLKVYVTDHHEQAMDRILDPAVPAVCEKSVRQKAVFAEAGREAEGFCGAELARRLIAELYEMRGLAGKEAAFLKSLCAYSGIATIADVIRLNAGNHCIARAAVDIIRSDTGFWGRFTQMVTGGKVSRTKADGDTFGFYFAPAINACSRVEGSIELPMSVFLYEGDAESSELAGLIGRMAEINEMRKSWTEHDADICEKIISENGYADDPFILIAHEGLREGINGLSAGTVMNRYGVPAIVLSDSGTPGIFKGSARSVDSVNIFEKLTECADLLEVYGGHPKAAGLSIREENIEEFRRRMAESIEKDLVREEISAENSDFILDPERFTADNIRSFGRAMETLLPFGEGFEKPILYLDADVDPGPGGIFYMSGNLHAKLRLAVKSADSLDISVMMWRRGEHIRDLCRGRADNGLHLHGLVNTPELNEYGGRISIQMTPEKMEIR